MNNENKIPEMAHPLSKHWKQPDRLRIGLGPIRATMSKDTFDKLLEYSTSLPTGEYDGKMWKAKKGSDWWLLWYSECDKKDCKINIRKIIIVDAIIPVSCPFCGGKLRLERDVGDFGWHYYEHEDLPDTPCIISTLCVECDMIGLWNNRVSEFPQSPTTTS